MKYSYVAKSVVRESGGKLLVLQRSATDPHAPGRVDLPGGGVENNERYAESAAREIGEEAGISVSVQGLQLVYTTSRLSSDGATTIVRFLYLTDVSDDKVVLSREHDRYEWLAVRDFCEIMDDTAWGEGIRYIANHGILALKS